MKNTIKLRDIQSLINQVNSKTEITPDDIASAQLALTQVALERRTMFIALREALLSLETAHAERIRQGNPPAIIEYMRKKVKELR